jgi:putative mycofactocin binding protein MftB
VTQYVLHPDCRVRKEEFGLLFYDLRGPKLLFVETGDLLAPALFEAGTASASAVAGVSKSERPRIERLLRSLLDKGFIREQPIC